MNKKTLIRGETLSINVHIDYNKLPITGIDINDIAAEAWFQNNIRVPLTVTKIDGDGNYNLFSDIDTSRLVGDSFLVNVGIKDIAGDAPSNITMASFNETFYIVNSATKLPSGGAQPPIAKPITVMFRDYDSTLISTQTITVDDRFDIPDPPTREGYLFAGWTYSRVSDVVTYTARYTEKVRIIYLVDGEIFAIQTYDIGDTVTAPTEVPTKSGYTFAGWADLPSTASEDVAIHVEWNENYSELVYASFTIRKLGLTGLTVIGRAAGNTDEYINVPPVHDGQPVIAIGKNNTADPAGFYMDRYLKKIKLPSSIKQINIRAFSMSPLEEIEIPDSVVYIMTNAFKQCNSLVTANIPASIVTSQYWSTRDSDYNGWFEQCANLVTINGLANLQYVPAYFVANCNKLEIPVFPNYLQISRWAFMGVNIGIFNNGCPRIGNYAFSNAKVKSFSTGAMYTTDHGYQEQIWASMPFAGITIDRAVIDGNDADYILCGDISHVLSVTFDDEPTAIGDKLLYKALDSAKSFAIDIPDSVTSVGSLAFGGNNGNNVILLNFAGDAPDFADDALGESSNAHFIIVYNSGNDGWEDISGSTFGGVDVTWKDIGE